MNRNVPESLRKIAANRALHRCEYCRLPSADSFFGFQVDHIISRKHGGKTTLENLAYSCPDCNRNKGSDLGTLDSDGTLIRFFNPRTDDWKNHFEMDDSGLIVHKTAMGAATIKIFQFNHPDRIIERNLLRQLGLI